MSVKPSPNQRIPTPYWCPFIVAIAYFPDIVNQAAMLLGTGDQSVITHSVPFALVVSPIIAACAARLTAFALRRTWIVTLATILIHDFLDFLQRPSRHLWWPLPVEGSGLNVEIIPTDPRAEGLAFGIAFAVFVIGFTILGRLRKSSAETVVSRLPRGTWAGRSVALAIVACACVTHQLRAAREAKYRQVHELLMEHKYQAVLEAVEHAERWPSVARPARLDYARAEAFLGLGDRTHAEGYYLRSYLKDPDYFWVVGDLAAFYADSDEPMEQRSLKAGPYLTELKERFPAHPELDRVVARIERKLHR